MCLATPGKIVSIENEGDPLFRVGRVDFGGVVREVNLSCVPEAAEGDHVLVHVGFAISRVNQAEADRILAEWEALGEEVEVDAGPAADEERGTFP